jgi:hypothetical protein
LTIKLIILVLELIEDPSEELLNTTNVEFACLLIAHKGAHELPLVNIVVLVVLIKDRNHHFLKLISIYIPTALLNSKERTFKVKFDITDTFEGVNDQFISDDDRIADV